MVPKNSITDKIKAEFKREYNVAVFPDFPHLISAPDILIGGNGKLCAIFIAKIYELHQPDLLLSRLVLSRLGLPDNLISVLVIPNDKNFEEGEISISRNFDLLLVNEKVKAVKQLLESDYKSRKLISETRHRTITRYTRFFYENLQRNIDKPGYSKPQELFHELRVKGGYQVTKTQNWNSQETANKGNLLEGLAVRENVNVLAGTFENNASPFAKLKKFCYRSLKFDYALDNGVPYIFNPKVNILLLDKIPYYKFDPQKPLRSSAFSGLVLSQVERIDDIEFLSDKLEKSMEKMR